MTRTPVITPQVIERGFTQIEQAAIAGQRAPTTITMDNPNGGIRAGITTALLKAGRIKVEVYGHNWRVIEILSGPNAGKRTAPPPKGGKPYRILP